MAFSSLCKFLMTRFSSSSSVINYWIAKKVKILLSAIFIICFCFDRPWLFITLVIPR